MLNAVMVLLPTYNEVENIEEILERILALGETFEALVIDDDSPDGTGKLVAALAARNDRLHLIKRKDERGRGLACAVGYRQALLLGAEAIVEMDADFSHIPLYIPDMLQALEVYDIVLGSRFISGGRDCRGGFRRRLLALVANWFARARLALPYRDCTTGFRAFKRDALETVEPESLSSRGPEVLLEVLMKAHRAGLAVGEIPILLKDRRFGGEGPGLKTVVATAIRTWNMR